MTKINSRDQVIKLTKPIISIDLPSVVNKSILRVNGNEITISTDKISPITLKLDFNALTANYIISKFFVVNRTTSDIEDANEKDYTLLQTLDHLQEGLWYHKDASITEAKSLLKGSKEGTFLLRNSSHSSFIFTLSITTNNGVTNIRIGYWDGLFYLDCDNRVRHKMPHFPDLIELIYYYSGRRLSGRKFSLDDHRTNTDSHPKCVWVDAKKRKYIPVQLTVPKLQSLSSLKHICRLRINSCIEHKCEQLEDKGLFESADKYRNQLPLPNELKNFLQSYPYTI